jgi:hypothetical protein
MKTICSSLILIVGLCSIWGANAQAQFGRSGVTCGVYDRGWDENGPDATCGQCLLVHGECVERCSESEFTCRATGEFRAGSSARIEVLGRFSSSSLNRNKARNQAAEQCSSALLRLSARGSCVDLGCQVTPAGRATCFSEAQRLVAGSGLSSVQNFEAISTFERDARDRALSRCYASGAINCSVQSCIDRSRLISSRVCDPRERDQRPDPRHRDPVFPRDPGHPRDPIGGIDLDPRRPLPPQDDGASRCTPAEYLAERPDVAAALGPNRANACDHYRRHGRNENMCNPCN